MRQKQPLRIALVGYNEDHLPLYAECVNKIELSWGTNPEMDYYHMCQKERWKGKNSTWIHILHRTSLENLTGQTLDMSGYDLAVVHLASIDTQSRDFWYEQAIEHPALFQYFWKNMPQHLEEIRQFLSGRGDLPPNMIFGNFPPKKVKDLSSLASGNVPKRLVR